MRDLTVGLAALLLVVACPRWVSADLVSVTVPGTADPWLAGMPDGSTASSGDVAPDESPVEVVGLTVSPGQAFTFSATGQVRYAPTTSWIGPDGDNLDRTWHQFLGAENGISNAYLPVNSLVGVFLDSNQPDQTPAPPRLVANLEFLEQSPALRQVFFMGDGLTSTGLKQQIIVPEGATRLFLGVMDGWGWFNNGGSFEVVIVPVPDRPTLTPTLLVNTDVPTIQVMFPLISIAKGQI